MKNEISIDVRVRIFNLASGFQQKKFEYSTYAGTVFLCHLILTYNVCICVFKSPVIRNFPIFRKKNIKSKRNCRRNLDFITKTKKIMLYCRSK